MLRCLAALALVLASSSPGQYPGTLYTSSTSLPGVPQGLAISAAADLDQDGDDDLVFAGSPVVYNDPHGVWVQRNHGVSFDNTLIPGSDSVDAASVALGDMNGDGALDILVSTSHSLWLATNDGAGNFAFSHSTTIPFDACVAMALGDVDGDGTLDLVGAGSGPNRLFLNDGTGALTDVSAQFQPRTIQQSTSIVLEDFDRDGDLDCYVGNKGPSGQQSDVLAINDGSGVFADATATLLPATSPQTLDVAAEDVDGDGDIDLVLASTTKDQLLINDGNGRLVFRLNYLPSSNQRSQTDSVRFLDADRDGDPDLWIGRTASPDALFLNEGTGRFAAAQSGALPGRSFFAFQFATADVNNDGFDDLILGTQQGNEHFLNDGSGVFRVPPAPANAVPGGPLRWQTLQVLHGDLNGDNAVDLVLVGTERPYVRALLGDGFGRVTEAPPGTFTSRPPPEPFAALADLDGDQDLDLVFTGRDLSVLQDGSVWMNNGLAQFGNETSVRLPPSLGPTDRALVGDVDADGDTDILMSHPGTPTTPYALLVNDGSGIFRDASATSIPTVAYARPRGLTDLDGDGDLDVVLAHSTLEFFLNDGSGSFVIAPPYLQRPDVYFSTVVETGDLDGDGDIDLIVNDTFSSGFPPPPIPPHLRVYHNDGGGSFGAPVATLSASGLTELVDIDGDGDLDLFGTDRFGSPVAFRNDGAGQFGEATSTILGALPAGHVHAGDLDNDLDSDLFFTPRDGTDQILCNETRHLRIAAIPRVGGTLTLQLRVLFLGASTSIAIPIAALAEQPLLVPELGVVRPDLANSIPLTFTAIPASANTAIAQLAIPNLPQLVGATVYAQALLIQPPNAILGITNTSRARIR